MPTIGGVLLQNAARVPDRDAVVDGAVRWSWAQLAEAAARRAEVLRRRGIAVGDRVAILGGNSAEYVAAELGALLLGAVVVPLNTRSTPPELAEIVVDSAPTVVLADDALRPAVVQALVLMDRALPVATLGELAIAAGAAEPVRHDRAQEHDDAFITYTSGTTGRPKGVLIDHHRAIWAALSQITSVGMRDGDRYLHLSPFYHSGGVVFRTVVTLLGGAHVIGGAFEPARTLELLERERVSAFLGVPTMYQQLLAEPTFGERDLGALRVAIFGAAAMPAAVIDALLSRLPHALLYQLCGQTEAGPTGLYSTTEQLRSRPDSTGHQSQPFLEHRVVGSDGAEVPAGAVGELLFRGEGVMKGYWQRPDATAEAVVDGWLHTGDLFRRDGDGALVLVDRLKDMIITGGQNVYSAEVERVVLSHPAVTDCAVIGRPHERYGATVVAVVSVLDGGSVTLEELREFCAPRLAHYKIPRDLVALPAIPRNAAGKVQKHRIDVV